MYTLYSINTLYTIKKKTQKMIKQKKEKCSETPRKKKTKTKNGEMLRNPTRKKNEKCSEIPREKQKKGKNTQTSHEQNGEMLSQIPLKGKWGI